MFDNYYLCCDSSANPNGVCISQDTPCSVPPPNAFGISFQNFPPGPNGKEIIAVSAQPSEWFEPNSFALGVEGIMSWSTSPTAGWWGVCLVSPDPANPTHVGPTEPVGCLEVVTPSTVRADTAVFFFPTPLPGPADAFELCYGLPTALADGGLSCVSPNTLGDALYLSPSGSCCAPALALPTPSVVGLGQEIPGVLPPYYPDDGGCAVPSDTNHPCPWNDFPPYHGECLIQGCNDLYPTKPGTTGTTAEPFNKCVPTTCSALGENCAIVDDGCGGKLDCVSACSTAPRCSLSNRAEPPVELLGLGVGLAYIFLAGRSRSLLRRNQ